MNFIKAFFEKRKAAKQKAINIAEFRRKLIAALEDGKLSDCEMQVLSKTRADFGITDVDIKKIKAEAYLAAFNFAKSDKKITAEEEAELLRIQRHLGLEDVDVSNSKKELARLRLLEEIQKGNIPTVQVPNLIIQKNEVVYWSESGSLIEEKVVSRRYEGGSRGVSIRIAKGVSYRVGSSKGDLIVKTGLVTVSDGKLVVTSKRIIFQGDKKSFAVKMDKVLDLEFYADGVKFSETNKAKPRIISFSNSENREIIGAVLSQAINQFHN